MNHICICKAYDEDPCIPSERQALLNFKHHLLDPSNRLASWSENTNCCNWTSVVCDNVSGHILQLHLRTSFDGFVEDESFERSQFGGEIDPSLLGLIYLSYLDLSGNYFYYIQIPSFLGSMKSLTYLNLSNGGFSGSIPHQIGNLFNLLHLDLQGNALEGSIPNSIQNLTLIEDLDLSYNLLNSSIPDSLYTLTHLKSLDLYFNNLQGPISHAIGNLTSMVTLDLSSNPELEGPIPSSLSSLCNLRRVGFSNIKLNHQVSQIIEIISNCASHTIHSLSISSAQLSCHLTPRIGIFKNLVSLSLHDNSIHGAIPISLGNLSSLNYLDLYGNSLHGAIPISLGNLFSLSYLDLSENSIHGAIPISLGNLSSLNHLGLYDNFIHGSIPIFLGNLTSLNDLDVSGNQFNGNPFDAIQSLSALQSLDISDNLFEGEVTKDHLANFTKLYTFLASRNKFILKVGPNWNPPFQELQVLYMGSWNLGPRFPSWMKSLKRLEHLSITNNNISDSLPTWVWDAFPYAYEFDFSNNNIHGDLYHIIKNPIDLTYIFLSSNHLSGPLPHISPNVLVLDLSNNSFSGSLDSFLCQGKAEQKGLIELNLESNNLSGEIPDCWMMWPDITFIKFNGNNLSGNLPQSLGSFPWLESLQLRNNTLSGNFPICLKNITRLVFLDLSENQFLGNIPLWVGYNLLNLKVFLLRSNKFIGSIPNQICCLNSLQILDLAENNLTGQIPKCINNLTAMLIMNTSLETNIFDHGLIDIGYTIGDVLLALKGRLDDYTFPGIIMSIDLSENKLSGEIPSQITSLAGLQFLNLSNNLLHGKIPQNIGNMGSLQSIDFSENKLSGEIPPSISKLNFLNKLNLSHNNLTGKIPTGTQLQSFEASSFVGNHLCGPPLLNNCNDLMYVPKHDQNAKEGKGGINWFYVSMSLGFVFGFWAVVGPFLYRRSWRYTYFWYIDRMWYKIQSFWC
ncbi:hypothetical protein K1719_020683 [Acacia pycnantha]|nr:hypothetical protein K1719_020683 [Acacia pycnantha]